MLTRRVAPVGVCVGLGLLTMALHPSVEAVTATGQLAGGRPGEQQEPRNGLITGRVVDAASGQPVAGAFVIMGVAGGGVREPPLPEPVVTDDQGRFFFARLPAGGFSLRARKSGWMEGAYGRGRPGGASRDLVLGENDRRGEIVIRL